MCYFLVAQQLCEYNHHWLCWRCHGYVIILSLNLRKKKWEPLLHLDTVEGWSGLGFRMRGGGEYSLWYRTKFFFFIMSCRLVQECQQVGCQWEMAWPWSSPTGNLRAVEMQSRSMWVSQKVFFLHNGWISKPDHSREIGQEVSRGDGKSRAYRVRVIF